MSPTKKLVWGLGVVVAVGVLYYGISPLFRNIIVNDALPQGATDMMPLSPRALEEEISAPETVESDENMAQPVQGLRPSGVERPQAEPAWDLRSPTSPVVGTFGHPASGTARLIEAEGKSYVRYENFKTINGPDLYVYLAKDLDAKEFVSLGRIKGTEGNINYEIPSSALPRDYPYVLTWCKAFSVLFNSARIN